MKLRWRFRRWETCHNRFKCSGISPAWKVSRGDCFTGMSSTPECYLGLATTSWSCMYTSQKPIQRGTWTNQRANWPGDKRWSNRHIERVDSVYSNVVQSWVYGHGSWLAVRGHDWIFFTTVPCSFPAKGRPIHFRKSVVLNDKLLSLHLCNLYDKSLAPLQRLWQVSAFAYCSHFDAEPQGTAV